LRLKVPTGKASPIPRDRKGKQRMVAHS